MKNNVGKEVALRHLAEATRQLELFVVAGIPIIEAVRILAEESDDRALRWLLNQVAQDLEGGLSLSAAFHRQQGAVPAYFVGVMQAAESSGSFGLALRSIGLQLEREVASRAAITRAASYPIVVLSFALVTLAVLTLYVVPQFVPLFEEVGAQMPFATRSLLWISRLVGDLWWLSTAGVVGVFAVVAVMSRPAAHRFRERIALRTPMLGPILSAAALERFCRVLALAVRAGVPMAEAMWMTTAATGLVGHRQRLDQARDEMWKGGGFTDPMMATGLFPGPVKLMLRVGEETGTLADQLESAGQYFGRRLETRISRMTTIIEPAMILGVGVVVGLVAMGLVSAVYGVLGGLEVNP
jgi:type IV pilus assembly protein PilC